jgi:hypothetical protein
MCNSIQSDKSWLASFDIGYRNFAFYIEELDIKLLIDIKNISKNERYNEDGTTTIKMQKILNGVCINGKTILHQNCDLIKEYEDSNPLYNMIILLDTYSNYWDKCSHFIIEQQMKTNVKATRLGYHCQSYFMFRYGRFKEIIEFPSYHKTQVLGCKKIKGKQCKNGKFRWKSIDKPSRKKWGIIKASEILSERQELETINNIKNKSKKDDLADTLIQLQAFKYLYFIDIKN